MKTTLDRLLANLTLRHEVRCICLPKRLPPLVKVKALSATGAWRHVVYCKNDQQLEQVIASFKLARLSYTLNTFTRTDWWVRWLNPQGKSFTYSLVWNLAMVSGVVWGSVNAAGLLKLL